MRMLRRWMPVGVCLAAVLAGSISTVGAQRVARPASAGAYTLASKPAWTFLALRFHATKTSGCKSGQRGIITARSGQKVYLAFYIKASEPGIVTYSYRITAGKQLFAHASATSVMTSTRQCRWEPLAFNLAANDLVKTFKTTGRASFNGQSKTKTVTLEVLRI